MELSRSICHHTDGEKKHKHRRANKRERRNDEADGFPKQEFPREVGISCPVNDPVEKRLADFLKKSKPGLQGARAKGSPVSTRDLLQFPQNPQSCRGETYTIHRRKFHAELRDQSHGFKTSNLNDPSTLSRRGAPPLLLHPSLSTPPHPGPVRSTSTHCPALFWVLVLGRRLAGFLGLLLPIPNSSSAPPHHLRQLSSHWEQGQALNMSGQAHLSARPFLCHYFFFPGVFSLIYPDTPMSDLVLERGSPRQVLHSGKSKDQGKTSDTGFLSGTKPAVWPGFSMRSSGIL